MNKGPIYISASGIGLGHTGRMMAVADILKAEGYDVIFSTFGRATRFVRSNGFRSYDTKPLMWEEEPDGSCSLWRSAGNLPPYTLIFMRHYIEEKKRLEKLQPSAIICDTRYSTLFANNYFHFPFFFVSNQIRFNMPNWERDKLANWLSDKISMAGYHWLRYCDNVFVPDFPRPHTVCQENMKVPKEVDEKLNFTGPICRTKPHQCRSPKDVRNEYGFDEDLFVYAAVSGPGDSREPIIDSLRRVLPRFKRKSLIVRGEPTNVSSRWEGDWVNIRGWVDDRCGLMNACEVVLARPGLTTISEIIRYGKPCILVPTPTQSEQEANARTMESMGIARMLEQREVDYDTLKEVLDDLSSNYGVYLKRMNRFQKMASEMDGAKNIAKEVMDKVESSN